MPARTPLVVVAGLACSLVAGGECFGQVSGHRIVAVSPECEGEPSLAPEIWTRQALLTRALRRLELDLIPSVNDRHAPAWRDVDAKLRGNDFLLFLYSGHGTVDTRRRSEICFGGERKSIEEDIVQGPLKQGDRDAVLVLEACSSAFVTFASPPGSRPVSVLSASQSRITTESGFSEALASALADDDAGLDANCDGLTTDEELFDALLRRLPGMPAPGSSTPELTRNTKRPLLLPIASRCREVSRRWTELEHLLVEGLLASSEEARALATDLRLQRDLARGIGSVLPRGEYDYVCTTVSRQVASRLRDDVTSALRAAHLVELPPAACASPVKDLLSELALASRVYEAELSPEWLRVVRLGQTPWLVLSEPLDRPELATYVQRAIAAARAPLTRIASTW